VRGVRDQLAEENFFLGIERVDDEMQDLADIGLELETLLFGHDGREMGRRGVGVKPWTREKSGESSLCPARGRTRGRARGRTSATPTHLEARGSVAALGYGMMSAVLSAKR